MKHSRTYLSILAAAGLAVFAGCESFGAGAPQPRVHTISDTVRVDESSETNSGTTVQLGAGDELGRAMFEHYTRVVRARQQRSDEATLVQSEAQ